MNENDHKEKQEKNEDKHPKEFPIHIDGKMYKVSESEMTGQQIKALASVGQNYDLWLEHDAEDDEQIQDAQVVQLKPGMKFTTAPSIINPGGN